MIILEKKTKSQTIPFLIIIFRITKSNLHDSNIDDSKAGVNLSTDLFDQRMQIHKF